MLKKFLKNQRDKAWEENKNNILKSLNSIPEVEDRILLDLGCDDGEWTMKVAEASKATKLLGIEIIEDRAALAEKKGIQTYKADLNGTFPFEDSSVDLIHANQVIEHLPDTDNFVDEISRILIPGGYAVISTEILSSWHNIFALMLGYNPFSLTNISTKKGALGNPFAFHSDDNFDWHGKSWQHQRIFTIRSIKELFFESGLECINLKTSGYYPIGNWFSRFDKTHSAFMVLLFKKK